MAIIGFSSNKLLFERVSCAICTRDRSLDEMTTGFVYAGTQSFACASHLAKNQERVWFQGWCRFIARQRIVAAFAGILRKLVVVA